MPKLLAALAITLVPLTALADAPPVHVEVTVNNAPTPPPAPAPAVEAAPSFAAPGVTPVLAPVAEEDSWCHSKWHAGPARRGRFGIGVAKGHVGFADDSDGRQVSLIARAQGRRGFGIELEMARAKIGDDESHTGGAALFKAFGSRRLAPYIIAGGGGGVLESAVGEQHLRYAEAGAGLMLKLRRVSLGVDVRRGMRHLDGVDSSSDPMTMAAVITPDEPERERYTRTRIMALLTF